MGAEQKDIYSKIERFKCDRAYAFAKDLEALCDNCNEKVGDHTTPLALRGVIAMVDGAHNNAIEQAKKAITENYGSEEELMQREVIAAELDALKQ